MLSLLLAVIAHAVAAVPGATDAPLVASAGSTAVINGWYMQSSAHAPQDMAALSQPGADVSSWYRVGSRGTVMVSVLAVALLS